MPAKILVVDDEEAISLALEFLLQRAGYEVAVAADGESALASVANWHPDLVLLDVMMPRKDGFEVCRAIRDRDGAQPRILMLTAKGREIEQAKGMAAGADDYLVKPFATDDLLARIAKLLGEAR
jgi:DNA-binding response OmpR family regulator